MEKKLLTYTLMNKNTPVLDFDYDSDAGHIVKVRDLHSLEHAPFLLSSHNKAHSAALLTSRLNEWWSNRVVSASRPHLRLTLGSFYSGIEVSGGQGQTLKRLIMQLAEINHGLSLSDHYWFNPLDSSARLEWKDINYFTNPFSSAAGDAFFAEQISEQLLPKEQNPNATLTGYMNKAWRFADGKILLYKASNELRQLYNELAACSLYSRLLSPSEYVDYWIAGDESKRYVVCENMLDENHELIPASHVMQHFNLQEQSKYIESYHSYLISCEKLGIRDIRRRLDAQIVCDHILANSDRHWQNFGLVRNVHSLSDFKIAPTFDTGNSLYYDTNLGIVAKGQAQYNTSRPFSFDPQVQLSLVSDLSWLDSANLEGFLDEIKSALLPAYDRFEDALEIVVQDIDKRIDEVKYLQAQLMPVTGRGLESI